jgi:hypothetical protein
MSTENTNTENTVNSINEKEEKFLFFYMQQTWEEMRHLENLRERGSVLILTIASIMTGFVIQQKFVYETKLMIWFIIILGVLGIFMGLKIFQIHQMGQRRLNKWNEYLISKCGNSPQIMLLKEDADIENKKAFKIVSKIPHNFFWTTINIFIIVIGFIMLTMINEPVTNNIDPTNKVEKEIEHTENINNKLIDSTKNKN